MKWDEDDPYIKAVYLEIYNFVFNSCFIRNNLDAANSI